MKKTVGIFCGPWERNWDETTLGEGKCVRGSESWAIYLASELQKDDYNVTIFAMPEREHFAANGVEYVPWQKFVDRCQYQVFDHLIISRRTDVISDKLNCDSIYVMCHDMIVSGCQNVQDLKLDKVKKFSYLSSWHKDFLKRVYLGFPNEKMFLSANGVDHSLYQDINNDSKENMMVWSSSPERGLYFFLSEIFPRIKSEVSDFKCIVATDWFKSQGPEGELAHELGKKTDGIEFTDTLLSKKELAELQKKAKIWLYPTAYPETFCITAVENALAGNGIVCSNFAGLSEVLNGYSDLVGKSVMGNDFTNEMARDEFNDKFVNEAVKMLTDEQYRLLKAGEAKTIAQKYTWSYVADLWKNEWKSQK